MRAIVFHHDISRFREEMKVTKIEQLKACGLAFEAGSADTPLSALPGEDSAYP